jgi:ADP-ribose pyrophosphatase
MSAFKNPWTTLSNKTVYENPWIKLTHREVITPKGTEGIYGHVHFKNIAVGIVPLDKNMDTWLVGQYRYTNDKYSWELPEGGCPEGEDPLEAAKRELMEETGIIAQQWTPLLNMDISNSVTDEWGTAFIAQELSFGPSLPEDTEELTIKKVPFEQAFEMVMKGEITDAFSMIMIMKTHILLNTM